MRLETLMPKERVREPVEAVDRDCKATNQAFVMNESLSRASTGTTPPGIEPAVPKGSAEDPRHMPPVAAHEALVQLDRVPAVFPEHHRTQEAEERRRRVPARSTAAGPARAQLQRGAGRQVEDRMALSGCMS